MHVTKTRVPAVCILPNHLGKSRLTPGTMQGIHEISREKKFAKLSRQATKITNFPALMCLFAYVIGQPSPGSCKYLVFYDFPTLPLPQFLCFCHLFFYWITVLSDTVSAILAQAALSPCSIMVSRYFAKNPEISCAWSREIEFWDWTVCAWYWLVYMTISACNSSHQSKVYMMCTYGQGVDRLRMACTAGTGCH